MDERYVWVAVRVNDGISQATEYRGRMEAEIFENITSNVLTAGWFRLDDIIWERDRIDVSQKEAGIAWGYSDTSYFRIEWLSRIVVLADSFVQGLGNTSLRH